MSRLQVNNYSLMTLPATAAGRRKQHSNDFKENIIIVVHYLFISNKAIYELLDIYFLYLKLLKILEKYIHY